MPLLVGEKFRVYAANSFASSFSTDSIYLYVGEVMPWDDDDNPPAPEDTVTYTNYIWNKMAGAVKIRRDQVALGIVRNNWESKVYKRWHHSDTALGSDYYVLAGSDNRSVYKCLDNNGGSLSTAKPTHVNLGITRESDGYAWKYMYTIPTSTFTTFAAADGSVIPVFTQSDVRRFSRPNAIIHVPISASSSTGIGSFYRGLGFCNTSYQILADTPTIDTTVSVDSATNEITIKADSGLSVLDDYYNNCAFLVTSGNAKGTYRRIVDTLASGQETSANLIFSSPVSNMESGDTFRIGPMVTESENEGHGFLGIGKTNKYGNVISIDVSMVGHGYANGNANVFINGNYHSTDEGFGIIPPGTGADVELILPPSGGGHGYNPAVELNAKYVIVSAETLTPSNHQTGTFVGYGNDLRHVGILKNPTDKTTGRVAKGFSYDMRTTLYFGSGTALVGNFNADDKVRNASQEGDETASGTVFSVCTSGGGKEYLTLVDVVGQFANSDTVHNATGGGGSARISSADLSSFEYPLNSGNIPNGSVVGGGLAKYKGEIVCHDNKEPFTRSLASKENFFFVFEF